MQIKNNIYSVGVQNPTLRIFDIIMTTAFGTTYNAYAVKGQDKTALIETVHADFFDFYKDNLKNADIQSVDYIVLNHTEPDHSGSLAKLLTMFPRAKVVGTQAAKIYLKNITNKAIDFMVVKDGDTISLGGKTLTFMIAPFLHWPDSMFTYVKEDEVLFSCDFLGAHYCGPAMYVDKLLSKEEYLSAFSYYYTGIFSPFSDYVLKGLAKIENLPIEMVCPSHGPFLQGDAINLAQELYKQWSTKVPKDKKTVSICYATAYGGTKMLAEQIKKGILEVSNCDIQLYNVNEHSEEQLSVVLSESDALLFGSPTINRDAVSPVFRLLTHIDAINAKNKTATAFGSFGWSGEAVPMMLTRLKSLGFQVNDDGFKACLVPSDHEKQQAYLFGKAFGGNL